MRSVCSQDCWVLPFLPSTHFTLLKVNSGWTCQKLHLWVCISDGSSILGSKVFFLFGHLKTSIGFYSLLLLQACIKSGSYLCLEAFDLNNVPLQFFLKVVSSQQMQLKKLDELSPCCPPASMRQKLFWSKWNSKVCISQLQICSSMIVYEFYICQNSCEIKLCLLGLLYCCLMS